MQCVTRSLFQFSRRERELLSFDLVFETRTRISFSQSRASRREREFLSLNLVLRDENENFFLQSRTSRRERELRLRNFSREFSGITFITCLLTDIFKRWLLLAPQSGALRINAFRDFHPIKSHTNSTYSF